MALECVVKSSSTFPTHLITAHNKCTCITEVFSLFTAILISLLKLSKFASEVIRLSIPLQRKLYRETVCTSVMV